MIISNQLLVLCPLFGIILLGVKGSNGQQLAGKLQNNVITVQGASKGAVIPNRSHSGGLAATPISLRQMGTQSQTMFVTNRIKPVLRPKMSPSISKMKQASLNQPSQTIKSKSSTVKKVNFMSKMSKINQKLVKSVSPKKQKVLVQSAPVTNSGSGKMVKSQQDSPPKSLKTTDSSIASTSATGKTALSEGPRIDHQLDDKLDHAWQGDTQVIVAEKQVAQPVDTNSVSRKQVDTSAMSTASLKPVNERQDVLPAGTLRLEEFASLVRELFQAMTTGDPNASRSQSQSDIIAQFDGFPEVPTQQPDQKLSEASSGDAITKIQLAEGGPTDQAAFLKMMIFGKKNLFENMINDQFGLEVPTKLIEHGDSSALVSGAKQLLEFIQQERAKLQQRMMPAKASNTNLNPQLFIMDALRAKSRSQVRDQKALI